MKLNYKWICGLLSMGLLSTTMTACSYPWSFLGTGKMEKKPGFAAISPQTEESWTDGQTGAWETGGTDRESAEKDREGETGSRGDASGNKDSEEPEEASNADAAERIEALSPLPKRFDYREWGRCPRVGSQGELGTCWAFATMIALESSLLPEELWDFSEDHISLRNSFGMDQDMGGDYAMAMAYLLAWQGPVKEEDDPYGDGESPEGLEAVKHVQEIQILGTRDYDAIKRAVYFHGGVQTSLYMAMEDEASYLEYYNEGTCSYYYNGTEVSNHDIVIVGWDDHYPRENFNHMPNQDGAFLCVNSWGAEFGEQGLFYVSYEDVNVGTHSLVYTRIEKPDNYDAIYQSDLCGWLGQLGYGEEGAYFSNVYQAKAEESLAAVGFYATGENTEYQIFLAEEAGERGELRLGPVISEGRLQKAGFYTVDLPVPVELKPGERFAVAVSIRTPGAIHPVAIEHQSRGEDGTVLEVDLSDGEGYISADGRLWTSVEQEQDSNVCLKAYTRRK